MFFLLTLKALAEFAIPGTRAVVVHGVERALAPVVSLPIHGDQGPDGGAGDGICGGVEGFSEAEISAYVSVGSRETKNWI
jgi:hypothetical protein